jgi:hypothetical protein
LRVFAHSRTSKVFFMARDDNLFRIRAFHWRVCLKKMKNRPWWRFFWDKPPG